MEFVSSICYIYAPKTLKTVGVLLSQNIHHFLLLPHILSSSDLGKYFKFVIDILEFIYDIWCIYGPKILKAGDVSLAQNIHHFLLFLISSGLYKYLEFASDVMEFISNICNINTHKG